MKIALVGLIGSGKGTTATYLKERYAFREFSFAAPL
jgi:dephospho-CoA kinase